MENRTSITAPKGIDKTIQQLQDVLESDISWLENAYGVAESYTGSNDATEPRVFIRNPNITQNLMPNDTSKAFTFFTLDPTSNALKVYDANTRRGIPRFAYNGSLILFCNLSKIDSTTDYRVTRGIVRNDLFKSLYGPKTGFTGGITLGNMVSSSVEDVYQGFSTGSLTYKYLHLPYYFLRVEFKLFTKDEVDC